MKSVITNAPGSIFLLGEHAVVYSGTAIAASIDLKTYCEAQISDKKHIKIYSEEFGEARLRYKFFRLKVMEGNQELFPLLALIEKIREKFRIKCGIEIVISSNIPAQSGLSSSSAVLCAILKSLSALFNLDIEEKEYYRYLISTQRKIHGGRASGVEIFSSSLGGINRVSFSDEVILIEKFSSVDLWVIIGNTGIKTKTSETVGLKVPELMKRNRKEVMKKFNEISLLCDEGFKALKVKDLIKLGQLMNKNQELLASLGLSHPKIDSAIKGALKAGALGAKLSGKGQGGVMIALTDKQHEKKVAKAIRNAGLEVIKTKIGI